MAENSLEAHATDKQLYSQRTRWENYFEPIINNSNNASLLPSI